MTTRAGFSLLEVLVALLLSVLVVSLASSTFATQLRVAERTLLSLEGDQSAALAWSILSAEIRSSAAMSDHVVGPGDSLRIRAFRGAGWPCPGDPTGSLRVAYRGDRAPNPRKDSVMALTQDGAWTALRLIRVGSVSVCPSTGGAVRSWTLSPVQGSVLFARLFESGTYSIGGGSLRYRSGRGGRQPVTAQRFDSAASLRGIGGPPFPAFVSHLPLAAGPYTPWVAGGRRTLWRRRPSP